MLMVEEVEFPVWLENQLLMRGWRPIDLANAANIPNATIVRILNGDRKAGVDSATAIARALNMEPGRYCLPHARPISACRPDD